MTRKDYLAKCKSRRREMHALRKQGWTLQRIADRFKVRYQAVQSALKNV